MPDKQHRSSVNLAQVAGATLFISLFIGLILLAIFYQPDNSFSSNFFDDVANKMQWK